MDGWMDGWMFSYVSRDSLLNACDSQKKGINMLFVLGGNGTHAGAHAIHEEVRTLELIFDQIKHTFINRSEVRSLI